MSAPQVPSSAMRNSMFDLIREMLNTPVSPELFELFRIHAQQNPSMSGNAIQPAQPTSNETVSNTTQAGQFNHTENCDNTYNNDVSVLLPLIDTDQIAITDEFSPILPKSEASPDALTDDAHICPPRNVIPPIHDGIDGFVATPINSTEMIAISDELSPVSTARADEFPAQLHLANHPVRHNAGNGVIPRLLGGFLLQSLDVRTYSK